MPQRMTVTAPNGQSVTITGDRVPTEAELHEIFAKAGVETGAQAGKPDLAKSHGKPEEVWGDYAASWLPYIGGAAGGLAGSGLMSIPLAALGGAGGRGLETAIRTARHGLQPQSQSMLGDVQDLAVSGAEQAAYEAGGQVAAKGLGWTGKQIYRRVLKPSISERLAPRAAETVDTGIREGINPFSLRQLKKIEPTITGLNNQVEGMVGSTGNSPIADPLAVAHRVTRTGQRFAGAGAAPEDRAAVKSVVQNFLKDTEKEVPVQVPAPVTRASQLSGNMPGATNAAGSVPTGFRTPANPLDRMVMDQTRNEAFDRVAAAQNMGQNSAAAHTPGSAQPMTTIMQRQIQPLSGQELLASRRATGASAGASSFGVTRTAETEARKELYHELGQEIGTHYPATQPLMNRERQLIDLKDMATRAHEREANASITAARHLLPVGYGLSEFGYTQDASSALKHALLLELATNPRVWARLGLEAGRLGRHPRVLANIPRSLMGATGGSDQEK